MPFDRAEYWRNYRKANAGKYSLKRSKPNPVSKKLAKMKTVYNHLRKDYLEEHEYCEARLPECTFIATEIHHQKGKIGNDLNDPAYFKAVCRSCHNWIENNPAEAKELGLSVSRLSV